MCTLVNTSNVVPFSRSEGKARTGCAPFSPIWFSSSKVLTKSGSKIYRQKTERGEESGKTSEMSLQVSWWKCTQICHVHVQYWNKCMTSRHRSHGSTDLREHWWIVKLGSVGKNHQRSVCLACTGNTRHVFQNSPLFTTDNQFFSLNFAVLLEPIVDVSKDTERRENGSPQQVSSLYKRILLLREVCMNMYTVQVCATKANEKLSYNFQFRTISAFISQHIICCLWNQSKDDLYRDTKRSETNFPSALFQFLWQCQKPVVQSTTQVTLATRKDHLLLDYFTVSLNTKI